MIEHVRRRALLNSHSLPVVVASGDDEILELIRSYGGNALKSNLPHENGLSRVGEASQTLGWEKYIVLQGDELLLLPTDLDSFISASNFEDVETMNLITKIKSPEELTDSSVVKCFMNAENQIFFIFRDWPIAKVDPHSMTNLWKICGLFSVSHAALRKILTSKNTELATATSIEQLKLIELGVPLNGCPVENEFPSINLQSDLENALRIMQTNSFQIKVLRSIL